MKKHCFSLVAVLALLLGTLAGCRKTDANPPVQNLPARPFDFSLEEVRQLKTFRWMGLNGVLTNGEEAVNTLYVTAYNQVSLEVTAPVNVASDQPSVVAVECTGEENNSFRLVYKGEGTAVIRLWNGADGMDRIQKEFRVAGRECVELRGVRFEYAGKPLVISHYMEKRPLLLVTAEDGNAGNEDNPARKLSQGDFQMAPYAKPDIWSEEKQTFVSDPDQGALLKFIGLEPENASFRTITAFESEWDTSWMGMSRKLTAWGIIEEGEYPNWPCLTSCREDVSYFTVEKPAEMWMACYRKGPFYMASIQIPVADGKTRYYYLYHAPEL